MRGKRAVAVTVLVVLALWPSIIPAQSQMFRYANVTYRLPAGWKVDKGYEWLPYYPDPKNGAPAVRMTISRPDYSRGKFLLEALSRIAGILYDPTVIRMDGPREITLPGGVTGIVASSVRFQGMEYAGANRCDLLAVIDLKDKFQVISVEGSDQAVFEKAREGAEQLVTSMVFDAQGGASPAPPPKATLEGVDKASEDIPYPISTLPTADMDAAAEAAAKAVRAGGKDAFPALVFAAVNSGFTVRNSKNGIVKYPASGKGNGYTLTAVELILYNDLELSGFSADLDSLCKELGAAMSRALEGTKLDLKTGLLRGLRAAATSQQKPVRFLARFLASLGRSGTSPYDLLSGDPPRDARLDAVQVLFLTRAVVGQVASTVFLQMTSRPQDPEPLSPSGLTMETSARGPRQPDLAPDPIALRPGPPGLQLGSPAPMPGYVEDAVVGAKTGVAGEAINIIEGYLQKAGKSTDGTSRAGNTLLAINTLNSIIKFVATYACLKAEFELSGGKKKDVLERTKNKVAGEEKTVQVKFAMDPLKLMQFLKDWRVFIANTGIDVDMPSAGPLAGLEVEWATPEISHHNLGDRVAYLQGEKDSEGRSDFLRSVTDSEGRTKVGLIGQPQNEDMSQFNPVPVRKSVLVQATIQVKRPEWKQDMVDAIMAAWGVFPASGLTPKKTGNETVGPLAWLTPILESFYRMKCIAPKSFRVPVIDWEYAGYLVDVSVLVSGSGNTALPDIKGSFRWGVSRTLEVEEIVMAGDKFPVLDPELLKMMNLEQPTTRTFVQFEQVPAKVKIYDYSVKEGESASCLDPKKKERFVEREDWKAPPSKPSRTHAAGINGVRFTIDTDKNMYYISFPGIGSGVAVTELTYTSSHQSGGGAPRVSGPNQYFTTLFFNLKPKTPALGGSLGRTIEGTIPPAGPDGRFPVIEGRKAFVDVTRVPFGTVGVVYSWRIEPVHGKSTEARGRTRAWDPWKGLDLTGPYTEEVEQSWWPVADDLASCHPIAFSVRPLPPSVTSPETNALSVIRPPGQGVVPAGNKPGTE